MPPCPPSSPGANALVPPARTERRSVTVEPAAGGAARLVKRFHHPRWSARLLDGRRARREAAALEHLHAAGVRVPRVLDVVREDAAWAVHMEFVEDAQDLRSAVGATPWLGLPPRDWQRVARALGRQLAALHAAGVDHPDLHAGNVLLDRDDRVWLVDFQSARPGRLDDAGRERDLVRAEGFLRERLAAPLRLRALSGYLAGVGRGRPGRGAERAWAARIGAAAPAVRRGLVERGLGRWLRASGLLARERTADGSALTCRALGAPVASNAPRLERAGPTERVRATWLAAARAHEHALPVVRPWRLELCGGRARATFLVPPGHPGGAPALERLLADRGLDAGPLSVREAPGGAALLAPHEP